MDSDDTTHNNNNTRETFLVVSRASRQPSFVARPRRILLKHLKDIPSKMHCSIEIVWILLYFIEVHGHSDGCCRNHSSKISSEGRACGLESSSDMSGTYLFWILRLMSIQHRNGSLKQSYGMCLCFRRNNRLSFSSTTHVICDSLSQCKQYAYCGNRSNISSKEIFAVSHS